jgi:predicted MPP superfamily phosphohydrolase
MFYKFLKRLIIPACVFAGLVLYIWIEVNIPATHYVNISVADLPTNVKLLHLSDSHGDSISENKRLMRAIRKFEPDIAVITGDMIDQQTVDFSAPLEDIKILSSEMPVLYIPGNHEYANPKGDLFIKQVGEFGATILKNDALIIKGISICGTDDINFGLDDIKKALTVNGKCDILLSHSPAISSRIKELNIPLVLAGHTHGGQVSLPVIGAVFLPDRDVPRNLVKGLVSENGTQFYISVGFGTSGFPIRFMNRSEITLITINPE